jgi:hypothetical protein
MQKCVERTIVIKQLNKYGNPFTKLVLLQSFQVRRTI